MKRVLPVFRLYDAAKLGYKAVVLGKEVKPLEFCKLVVISPIGCDVCQYEEQQRLLPPKA